MKSLEPKFYFKVFALLVMIFSFFSCEKFLQVPNGEVFCPSTIWDQEGNSYRTFLFRGIVGKDSINQCWMTENLNRGIMIELAEGIHPDTLNNQIKNQIIEKFCFKNESEYCNKWGALYTWSEAMNYFLNEGAQGICPEGWHIPTDVEWRNLELALGMSNENSLKVNEWRTGSRITFLTDAERLNMNSGEGMIRSISSGMQFLETTTSLLTTSSISEISANPHVFSKPFRREVNKNNSEYLGKINRRNNKFAIEAYYLRCMKAK